MNLLKKARGQWRMLGIAFILGLGIALGQSPISISYLALLSLVGLFAILSLGRTARDAFFIGWAAGIGQFLLNLFWIVEPFFVEPERHAWMAPFVLLILPAFLGVFWALAFWGAARLAEGWRKVFLAAIFLAIAETSRAFVFTGFPWALIGYIWIDTPFMQAAAVVGPHGLTLGTVLVAAAGAVWIGRARRWLIAPGIAVMLMGLVGLWGVQRQNTLAPVTGPQATLRVVQPNAEQSLKWDPGKAQEFLGILLENTAAAPDGPPPDLIIWPETSFPYLLNGSEALLRDIDRAAGGRPVAFGTARISGDLYFNSLVVTAPGGAIYQVYDKYHLVPFGEYVPFGNILGQFGIRGMAVNEGGGFAAGAKPQVIDLGPLGKVQPLICYEAIFPQHLHLDERADWVLQITNDAWFGETTGPYQHLAQARMRAVEQGLPVVRSANTGVSAVIDAYGGVVNKLELGKRGFIDAALPSSLPLTPYAKTGDLPLLILLTALASGLVLTRARKSD